MEPTDQELYDQLLGYLRAEGAVEEDEAAGVVVLLEFDHRVLERPLRLHVTPEALGRHLRAAAPDASGLYPDVPPAEAAWRLFTVHLDEAVQTARSGETELVLVSHGVASTRPDGSRTPLLPEIEERIALDRYYERLVDHLADRAEMAIEDDALVLHTFDNRTYAAPLRIRVTSGDLRRELAADDAETLWSSVVGEIARLAATVDPGRVELALTPGGVVSRPRSIEPVQAGRAPSHGLAHFLAGALRAVLPSGVGIEADGPEVVVRHDGLESRNGTATVLDDEDGRFFDDRLLIATRAVISHVQDVAAMVSTTPWPATGSHLPLPDAEVANGRLRAWIGEREAPVLRLGEIEVATLTSDGRAVGPPPRRS